MSSSSQVAPAVALVPEFQTDHRAPAIAWLVCPETAPAVALVDPDGCHWRPAGLRVDGQVVLACDAPVDRADRGDGPSYPWTVASVTGWFGPLVALLPPTVLDGCGVCGVARRGHARQWKPPVGWHRWELPSVEQCKARMLARRAVVLARKAVSR